jgi:DNA-binding NarL/FixJ family response regulator
MSLHGHGPFRLRLSPGCRPMNMLIVEDHPFVADATKALFLSMGVPHVEVCKSADEALALLRNKSDWFRIWLDINVPGARGLSLIRQIAEMGLASRSAVITAADNQQWRMEVQSLGFLGYVLKTVSVEEFNNALGVIIRGDYYHETPHQGENSRPLTARQIQILRLLYDGLCTKLISRELNISCGSVDNHISNIISALSASDRTNAVVIGIKRGYIEQNFQ